MDRFLLRIKLGYPTLNDEIKILELQQLRHPIETLESVIVLDELLTMQQIVKTVYVAPMVKRYIVELVRSTRDNVDVYLGSSPRGSLGLFKSGQAWAAIHGRDFVLPDDVKAVSEFVLSHRMVVNPSARLREISAAQIVQESLRTLPVPGGDMSRRFEAA